MICDGKYLRLRRILPNMSMYATSNILEKKKNYEHGIFSCSTGTSALKNKCSLMNFIERGVLRNFKQIDHDRPG